MGIKGLTGYVTQNSNNSMKQFELHDTDLVIDGDSTAYQLYCNRFSPRNCCFSGDYDRYGMLIKSFFDMLLECNIKPIFIFDGGYDDRKMNTIEQRMKERIKIGGSIDTVSKDILFPLFLGDLFKNIAVQYNFPVIRCDYEGDLESANIAKALNCPVLSNDSDFYIFDVLYIPFTSLKQPIRKILLKGQCYSYIPCEVFVTEKFLKFLKLPKDKLPLFATLLGNDYVDRRNLSQLFGRDVNDRRYGSHNRNFRYIEMLASWLRQEKSINTAIEKVLSLRKFDRDKIEKDLQETMNGYICKSSKYMIYIQFEHEPKETNREFPINIECNLDKSFLEVFLSNSRRCLYPSCFMNMLIQNTYYIRPQVEDHGLESSHTLSIEIISAINQILKNPTEPLRFYTRIQTDLKEQLVPFYPDTVPTYLDVQNMSLEAREKLLLDILHINRSFVEGALNNFPNSWKLYVISIKYMCDKSAMNWSLIQPILLCKLLLEYVDKQIGFYRDSKKFNDKFKPEVCKILFEKSKCETIVDSEISVGSAIDSITYADCLIAQKNLISFFEMNQDLVFSAKTFNRRIVHALSQFQSCFYQIGFLNNLLKSPYEKCPISECFNGTFIYNMTRDLRRNTDEDYISFLLQNAASLLTCFKSMIGNLKTYIDVPFLPTNQGFNI